MAALGKCHSGVVVAHDDYNVQEALLVLAERLDGNRVDLMFGSIVGRGVDGVVGYHFCLTHRRSSVRTWVGSCFYLCLQDSHFWAKLEIRMAHWAAGFFSYFCPALMFVDNLRVQAFVVRQRGP